MEGPIPTGGKGVEPRPLSLRFLMEKHLVFLIMAKKKNAPVMECHCMKDEHAKRARRAWMRIAPLRNREYKMKLC